MGYTGGMWVSTKAQYGLRALVEIGLRAPRAVPLKEVAEAQGISQHYLEQIAAQLRNAGFIRSVRGRRGYRLARPRRRSPPSRWWRPWRGAWPR